MGQWRMAAGAAAAALVFGGELPAQTPPMVLVAAAQPAGQVPVSADLLIGRWTDNDDCNNIVEFYRDGRFLTSDGVEGRWSLSGDRLSFIGQRTITARLTATDRDHIVLTHDDGSVGHSSRCTGTAPRRVTMPPLPATIDEAVAMSRPFERPLLIGRWTDTGNCSEVIDFLADGRFVVGGGGGTWTLVGERLTFVGERTVGAQARAVGRDRIILIHDDRSIGQSIRC